mmetsp:Transcript_18822/g.37758  ORF Transcript_18822/g.37758 Transcript_18822/m.37758 type:complete len:287 (+) Transcript_18822:214-1074(+)
MSASTRSTSRCILYSLLVLVLASLAAVLLSHHSESVDITDLIRALQNQDPSGRGSAGSARDSHEVHTEKNSLQNEAHSSWGHFIFELLESSEDVPSNYKDTLGPHVFQNTGRNYDRCAIACDLFIQPQDVFPPSLPQEYREDPQEYCSTCRAYLIDVAENKAKLVLELEIAAQDGLFDTFLLEPFLEPLLPTPCRSRDGTLHQPGASYTDYCGNACTCGSSICTTMACRPPVEEPPPPPPPLEEERRGTQRSEVMRFVHELAASVPTRVKLRYYIVRARLGLVTRY